MSEKVKWSDHAERDYIEKRGKTIKTGETIKIKNSISEINQPMN